MSDDVAPTTRVAKRNAPPAMLAARAGGWIFAFVAASVAVRAVIIPPSGPRPIEGDGQVFGIAIWTVLAITGVFAARGQLWAQGLAAILGLLFGGVGFRMGTADLQGSLPTIVQATDAALVASGALCAFAVIRTVLATSRDNSELNGGPH